MGREWVNWLAIGSWRVESRSLRGSQKCLELLYKTWTSRKDPRHSSKNHIRSWRRRLRYLKTWPQLLGEVTGKVQSCWRKYVTGVRIQSLAPLPDYPLDSCSWFKIRCLSCLLQVPAAMPPLPSQTLPWEPKVKINSFRSGFLSWCLYHSSRTGTHTKEELEAPERIF